MKEPAKARLDVTLVLSNRLVRYATVPFEPSISGEDEELALARHCFARIHGEPAKRWEIRVSGDPRDAARLACAIDRELLEAIRSAFPRAGRARLVSVQPYLMAAFNLARPRLGQGGWIVLLERARACFACVTRRGWQAVQTLRVDRDAPSAWLDALEREHLRTPGAEARVGVVHGAGPMPSAPGWSFSRMPVPVSASLPA